MSEADRDLAEAIYAEMCSEATAAGALDLWQHRRLGPNDRWDMGTVLRTVTRHAIDSVLARRLSEAARTGPWDAPYATDDDVERARDLFLTWMRTRPGGVYQSSIQSTEATRLFGMIAAALREEREACARANEAARTGPQEEDGYPGSLLPPKRGEP